MLSNRDASLIVSVNETFSLAAVSQSEVVYVECGGISNRGFSEYALYVTHALCIT